MSVTIHWRPTSDKGKSFDFGTSSELEALRQACGDRLDERDIVKLRAMSIATRSKFYDEIADIIEKVGSINVWGEW